MATHILKHLRVALSEVAENVVVAIDVESSSAAFALGVRAAHGPYCLITSTSSASFPKYIGWRKRFKEWELQCNSLGRKGGNAELEAGGSLSRQVNPGELFPALEHRVNLRQDQEQCYLKYLAANASFPSLLWEFPPFPLRWALWALTHSQCWISPELIEALPNRILFPFGEFSVSFTARVSHLFFSWAWYIWLHWGVSDGTNIE